MSATLRDDLDRALEVLNERERLILVRRFGLDNCEAWTLDEIGAHFGLTRERIRQLQVEALRKLQRSSSAQGQRDNLRAKVLKACWLAEFEHPVDRYACSDPNFFWHVNLFSIFT